MSSLFKKTKHDKEETEFFESVSKQKGKKMLPVTYPSSHPSGNDNTHRYYPNAPRKKAFTSFFTWQRKRPTLVLILTYICVFTIGAAAGFSPFIKEFVNRCNADRDYANQLSTLLAQQREMIMKQQVLQTNITQPAIGNTGALEPWLIDLLKKINQQVEKSHVQIKKAVGKDDNDIVLTCIRGNVQITTVHHGGIKADKASTEKVNKYCNENIKMSRLTQRCIVSLKSVFQSSFENSITEITYVCVSRSTK